MTIWRSKHAVRVMTGGLLAAFATPGHGEDTTACHDLEGIAIAAEDMSLPSGGAAVTQAELIEARNGSFCKLLGAISPVDPKAPDILFEVNLPQNWNHKALHMGGGGYNGSLVTGLDGFKLQPPDQPTPLERGYATFGSDSGHQSESTVDGRFALNDEALVNFGGDQLKKTHDAALTLIEAHYGQTAEHVYFHGASQGGHEALLVVQRWPQDYDGVVSIYPVYNFVALQLDGNALAKAVYRDPGGWLSPDKVKHLQQTVMEACDGLDGAEDGIISHVKACRSSFDPATLSCRSAAANCLSEANLATVRIIASRVELGLKLQAGVSSFAGWPILEGADWSSIFTFGTRPEPGNPPEPMADFGLAVLSDPMVRYMVTRDAATDPLTFEPQEHQERLIELSRLIDANDSDISAFRDRGGKLLLMHGTVDSAVPPANTIDYYHRLIETFGQNDLNAFVRFYIVPGFGHNSGPFIVGWDSLTALERWVEDGEPPGQQDIVDLSVDGNSRTRPLCVFPRWPKFQGGDLNDAASFACVE